MSAALTEVPRAIAADSARRHRGREDRQASRRVRRPEGRQLLSSARREIFGVLGPNGADKSTLIRMTMTLIPATAGKAYVAGHDVEREADEVRRSIGVIPQALTSDPDLTADENLSIYAKALQRAAHSGSRISPSCWKL